MTPRSFGRQPQPVVLAIDPGPTESAWVAFDGSIIDRDKSPNDHLLGLLRDGEREVVVPGSVPLLARASAVVIEKVESFGMAVGAEVFETVYWSGRFAEAAHPLPVHRIGRKAVKLHLCQSMRAKDTNIRQALIDRYGPNAIGKKANPGPLYGISGDVWSALAVAVTFTDKLEEAA